MDASLLQPITRVVVAGLVLFVIACILYAVEAWE